MIYPKIDTIFERDPETFVVNPEKLKHPVIGTIKEWDVTEKVDGTNIRVTYTPPTPGCEIGDTVVYNKPTVTFAGRSDNASIPGDLLTHLHKTFPVEKLAEKFQGPVVLYGEGYGAGIQKAGKLYRPDKSFILFDVLVDGVYWLKTSDMIEVARSLRIDHVPYLGQWSFDRIIDTCMDGFNSVIPQEAGLPAEGIVARPLETLFDSRHERVIIKLKTRDFIPGKR